MNQLTVLNYQQNEVRVVMQDGKPWWVLKDVCDVLCLTNSRRVSDRLDEDEKGVTLVNTLGGNQEMTVINESGLYNVIIRSDKPEAKQFKRWITHDVLPSIRKHGMYATEELLANPDLLIQVATALKAERAENARLQSEITASKPKVLFADSVSVSGDTILIGELAKILKGNGIDIGQNRLYERLRQMGYLIRRNGTDYNAPTQRSMDLGLFRVKETAVTHSDGRISIRKTTKVTGKGQQYFVNLFLGGQQEVLAHEPT